MYGKYLVIILKPISILHHLILHNLFYFYNVLELDKVSFNNKHKTFISFIIFSTGNNISSFTSMAMTWFICPFTAFVFLVMIKRYFYLWFNNRFYILKNHHKTINLKMQIFVSHNIEYRCIRYHSRPICNLHSNWYIFEW